MSARQPLTAIDWDDFNDARDDLESEAYAQGYRAASARHPETEISDERAFRRDQLRAAVLRLLPLTTTGN